MEIGTIITLLIIVFSGLGAFAGSGGQKPASGSRGQKPSSCRDGVADLLSLSFSVCGCVCGCRSCRNDGTFLLDGFPGISV